MRYEEVVQVVKEVTNLHQVPVYLNDKEANFSGTAYFGIGEHYWDIAEPEMLDHPMFELIDLIENTHLKYFHVGLPSEILVDKYDYVYLIVGELLAERGIELKLDKELLEVFVILHEFGHAHELFISYKGDLQRYLSSTTKENQYISYQIKMDGLCGTEEGLRIHKSKATEKYADNFALSYFEKVIDAMKRCPTTNIKRSL